jgi:SAM-dependent methyltransferase
MNTVIIDCPLCGEVSGSLKMEILKPDRFERAAGVSAKGYRRTWSECLQCGILVDNPPVDIREVYSDNYYNKDLEGESVAERYSRVMALPKERSDNWLRTCRICDFIVSAQSTYSLCDSYTPLLTDIGAGSGVFIARFLERFPNWRAVAIEPNPEACDHMRSLKRFEVFCGLYSSPLYTQKSDLITLNKVLEHVRHPVELLKDVAKGLTPTGVVYVEVPDKLTVNFRESTDNILGALHWHLYTPETLALALTKAGIVPIQIQRYLEPSGKITVSGFGIGVDCISRIFCK